MHQSGRSETIASIRVWPQAGSQWTSPIAFRVRPRRSLWSTRDEPLLGRPEDHRLLAPPAVRDSCATSGCSWKRWPDSLSSLDDRRVGREDLLAGQPVRGLVGEPARLVDRAQDREADRPGPVW